MKTAYHETIRHNPRGEPHQNQNGTVDDAGDPMVPPTFNTEIGKGESIYAMDQANDGRKLQEPRKPVEGTFRGIILEENADRIQQGRKGSGGAPRIP